MKLPLITEWFYNFREKRRKRIIRKYLQTYVSFEEAKTKGYREDLSKLSREFGKYAFELTEFGYKSEFLNKVLQNSRGLLIEDIINKIIKNNQS
jgi:hypothetical protein